MKKEISEKLKISRMLSILIIGLGLLLVSYMIAFEGELGALPLLLIIAGTTWFVINRARIRKQPR